MSNNDHINLGDPAAPCLETGLNGLRLRAPGLTIRQYAAITLRVPMSGDPELDAMIREARRLDMATSAMQGMLANRHFDPSQEHQRYPCSLAMADDLLAASEKGGAA